LSSPNAIGATVKPNRSSQNAWATGFVRHEDSALVVARRLAAGAFFMTAVLMVASVF
jgi:hypothetical protein